MPVLTDLPAPITHLPMRLSGNQIAYNVEAADETYTDRTLLRYRLQLFVPTAFQGGTFNQVIELDGAEEPPVVTGSQMFWNGCDFDLGARDRLNGILASYLATCAPASADQTAIAVCPDLVRPYYVKTRFEASGVVHNEKTGAVEYVLRGRLDVEQFPGWKDQFFTTYLDSTPRFLTWQHHTKTVDRAQPEFLYFLVNFSPLPALLTLRCRVYYTDSTSEVVYSVRSISGVGQYQVYCVPVGFNALGIAAKETASGKEAFRYDVWLNNEDGQRVSEVRRYIVNRAYQRNVRYLLFANSLGGFDTLRCTGQVAENLALTTYTAQQRLNIGYLPSSSEVFVVSKTGERTLTVATGYRDPDDLAYLSELAYSEEVYVVTKEGLVAVVATDGGYALPATDEDLAGRVFSFRFAKTQGGFSNLPAATPAASRPTYWQPIQPYCLIDDTTGLRNGYQGASRLELHYADTNEKVPGLRPKANVPGTEGYYAPALSSLCAGSTTPYRSAGIDRQGTYLKSNCGGTGAGTSALVSVVAGRFGSEVSQAQADQRAEAAWSLLNTQAFADANGSCLAGPQFYTLTGIPTGKVNFRFAAGMLTSCYFAGGPAIDSGLSSDEVHTNGWAFAGNSNGSSTVLAPGTNDGKVPASFGSGTFAYRVNVSNATGTFNAYVNGTLVYTEALTSFSGYVRPTWGTLASGDRIYLEIV